MTDLTPLRRSIAQLRKSALLSEVSEEDLMRIDPAPEVIRLLAGETLIRQGDTDSDYYVLISGQLKVFVRNTHGQVVATGFVRPGEGVGEMALLMSEPRTATVVARLDCELVKFPQKSFLNLVETHPVAAMAMARMTIRRLQDQYKARQRRERLSTIAIIPLGPGLDCEMIARDLAHQLSAVGSSAAIPRDEFADADTEAGHGSRFERIECSHDYVVYAASGLTDAWSRECLLRCDLVLLAATAGSQPEPGLSAETVFGRADRELLGRIDLLLVHGPDWVRDCGTALWLDRTAPTEHHHLRAGNSDDSARLARIILGTANNLVLSGGGAKSFSQIGSLRAFAEAGIPIDRAGGSSMGAFMAALHCYGADLETIVQQTRGEFIRRRPARDFTLPLLSFLSGKRLAAVATAVCEKWRIEDLPYRYFCLSADLKAAELVKHFDGSLWTALRSSCALPGIAPPLLSQGRILVDGGVLNNLPVDVMSEHFSGALLAVDVIANSEIHFGDKYEAQCPGGFELLLDRINPFSEKHAHPSIMEVMFRSAVLSSQRQTRIWRDRTDLLIQPPVQKFKVTDFDDFDRIVEAGYRHTVQVLENTSTFALGSLVSLNT